MRMTSGWCGPKSKNVYGPVEVMGDKSQCPSSSETDCTYNWSCENLGQKSTLQDIALGANDGCRNADGQWDDDYPQTNN